MHSLSVMCLIFILFSSKCDLPYMLHVVIHATETH